MQVPYEQIPFHEKTNIRFYTSEDSGSYVAPHWHDKEHYNERISLKKIAGIAAFEPKYFCRFFKKHMGVTFLEYQNELRLSRIYEDIIHTDGKISDILEKHGFTNYKLFRRMFDARFHMTPTQLRN